MKAPQARVLLLATFTCFCCISAQAADRAETTSHPFEDGARQASSSETDASYSAQEYARLGMPDHDRVWSEVDMAQAARVLHELAKKNPQLLPRYRSDRSGEVFARIVSAENLRAFDERTTSPGERYARCITYIPSLMSIFKCYAAERSHGGMHDSEMIEFYGALLRGAASILAIADELEPTLDESDPDHDAARAGFDQMKQGAAVMVTAAITALTENDVYTTSERIRLIGHLRRALPPLLPHLPDESRLKSIAHLRAIARSSQFEELRSELQRLVELLGKVGEPESDE